MASYHGPAAVTQGDTCLTVSCTYSVFQATRSGRDGWSGTLSPTQKREGGPTLATGAATLELPDGRRGGIVIYSVSTTGSTALFEGQRHPPTAASPYPVVPLLVPPGHT
jgi:hypothetical protein